MDLILEKLPVQERYKLLIGLVIPRPIAWVSTWSENGVANCALRMQSGGSSEITLKKENGASIIAPTAR